MLNQATVSVLWLTWRTQCHATPHDTGNATHIVENRVTSGKEILFIAILTTAIIAKQNGHTEER